MEQARLIPRKDRFYEEVRLPSAFRAKLSDYKKSGFDRGHAAPAAVMPTANAMAQSFSLVNVYPQNPTFNRGVWARSVEKATRKYINRAQGDVFVFTGTHYQNEDRLYIGTSKVRVPGYVYKFVYDPGAEKSWAHFLTNRSDTKMTKPISRQVLEAKDTLIYSSDRLCLAGR